MPRLGARAQLPDLPQLLRVPALPARREAICQAREERRMNDALAQLAFLAMLALLAVLLVAYLGGQLWHLLEPLLAV